MFVEPTRIRSGRDRRGAAIGLLIAAVATAAALFAVAQPGTPGGASSPAGTSAAAASSTPASVARATAAPDVLALVPPRSPFLAGRMVVGPGPDGGPSVQLVLSGWLPAQYGWATIEVVSRGRTIAGTSLRVASDGTFSDGLFVDPRAALTAVVLRLSGLNEEQLQAVPLLSVTLSTPAGTTLRQPAASRPR